jgi:hypothetical protein
MAGSTTSNRDQDGGYDTVVVALTLRVRSLGALSARTSSYRRNQGRNDHHYCHTAVPYCTFHTRVRSECCAISTWYAFRAVCPFPSLLYVQSVVRAPLARCGSREREHPEAIAGRLFCQDNGLVMEVLEFVVGLGTRAFLVLSSRIYTDCATCVPA